MCPTLPERDNPTITGQIAVKSGKDPIPKDGI